MRRSTVLSLPPQLELPGYKFTCKCEPWGEVYTGDSATLTDKRSNCHKCFKMFELKAISNEKLTHLTNYCLTCKGQM
jgi:hypothetical protein